MNAANQAELAAFRAWQHKDMDLLRQTLEKDRESDKRAMTSSGQATQNWGRKWDARN
jgi:hypothetical protein